MALSLRSRVLGATKWTTASVALSFAAQFVQYMVLARVLAPSEIGEIAIVTVVMGLADLFVGMGITQSIVQRRRVTSWELSSLYWLNLAAAVVIGVVVFGASRAVAGFFGDPKAVALIQLASVLFVVSAFGQVARAQLEKYLLFQAVAVAEVAGSVTLLLASTALALVGLGAASAIWALLVAAIVRNALYRAAARRLFRLRWHFAFAETRRFLRFGLLQSVDSVINYVQNNLSTVATGRFVSTAAMGGYNLSYNLAVNTPAKINPIITRVMFPVFSAMQRDAARMRSGYETVNVAVGVASVPALAAVALLARPVLVALYGEQWAAYAPVLAVLCGVGALRAFGNPVGFIVMATDNMRLGVAVNGLKALFTVPAILVGGYLGGAFGAALGVGAAQVFGFGVSAAVLKGAIRLPVRRYLWSSAVPVLLALPMALVLLALNQLVGTALPLWPGLILRGVAALAVLAATFLLWREPHLLELRAGIAHQLWGRRGTGQEIAVVLPAEERFDGTGGAVAHWVQRVYRSSERPYRVYCPSTGAGFSAGLRVHRLAVYDTFARLCTSVDRIAHRRFHRAEGAVRRRLLADGRVYLWFIAPAVSSATTVHIHNRPGYASWLRRHGYRGKIVLHMHNDLADYPGAAPDVLLADIDSFIFCSDYLRFKAEREFGLARTATVHNGVDPSGLADLRAPRRRHLVFAGRIIEEKGALETIEVCNRLLEGGEGYTLSLFGGPASGSHFTESSYYRRVEEAAAETNRRHGPGTVVLRGHLGHDELLRELGTAWAFLYPCKWEEPFGLVVAEAMAVGTPVIAYAKGGIPEILQNGRNGRLIDRSEGTDAFVAAVRDLDDDTVRSRIAADSRTDAARRFSWPELAEQAFALL